MDKNKKYHCLVCASTKHPSGQVLIWSDQKTASQVCANQNIPFGKVYSVGEVVYEQNKWRVLNLDPLFNGYSRLPEDEHLILKKIEQMEQADLAQQAQALKNKKLGR